MFTNCRAEMDFLFFICYLLFFSLFGWILYFRDCRLALYLIAIIFFISVLEMAYIFYYRQQGIGYREIFSKMLLVQNN